MLDSLDNVFQNLGSEFLRLKHFESFNTFIKPICVAVGQRLTDKKIHSRVVVNVTNCTYQYIPIKKTLQSFLELPSVFESICSYMSTLKESHSISNIIQGELWKNTLKDFENKTVFPIFIYNDDFEIGNPLGSHAGIHKVCGIYFSLGCLPPEYASLLENIFLLQLCYSSDIKSFGNEKMFQHVINELTLLENNGLEIRTETVSSYCVFQFSFIIRR